MSVPRTGTSMHPGHQRCRSPQAFPCDLIIRAKTLCRKAADNNTPIWKSSPLVLLKVMDRANDMKYLDKLEEKISSTAVGLRHTRENWYLRERNTND
jgi:hypothetical protein